MPDLPGVFISSTFYDLNQVRADLVGFAEDQLGYRPLVSELPSFPVDPNADTIENCRRRVDEQADIFILIIGGRYGSVNNDQGKSVTNLEYLAARAKGIPIYAFVQREVLAVLPTWNDNPDADFSGTVDSIELFAFLERVRTGDMVWMYPFTTEQVAVANAVLDALSDLWMRHIDTPLTPEKLWRAIHGKEGTSGVAFQSGDIEKRFLVIIVGGNWRLAYPRPA